MTMAAAAKDPRLAFDAPPVKVGIGAEPVPVGVTAPVPVTFEVGAGAPVAKPVTPPPTELDVNVSHYPN